MTRAALAPAAGGRRMRRAALALAAAALLAAAPAAQAGGGLEVVESRQLSPRLFDLKMTTPALAKPVRTRILLPDGYAEQPERRYPVLYLLHGGYGSYIDWTEQGAAEEITAGAPVIVVMPEDGNGGWYTDWHNGGGGGAPMWETFHIRQLMPWVDATYRTIPDRGARAVAGPSTGGFGAMTYAARHPDKFAWAASFSGAVDTVGNVPVWPVIATEAIADGGGPDDVFGSRLTDEIVWRAHNPRDLAANLHGLTLHVLTGNGQQGPYDERTGFDWIEHQVREMSVSFHHRLTQLGIEHVWKDRLGTHKWAYWQRDLRETLPSMLATFADPPATPSRFTHTRAEPAYEIYDWRVAVRRAPRGFSTLDVSGPHGFSLRGRGTASVLTGPLYAPGAAHRVRFEMGTRTGERRVVADDRGRLHLSVPLGGRAPASTIVTVHALSRPARACRASRTCA